MKTKRKINFILGCVILVFLLSPNFGKAQLVPEYQLYTCQIANDQDMDGWVSPIPDVPISILEGQVLTFVMSDLQVEYFGVSNNGRIMDANPPGLHQFYFESEGVTQFESGSAQYYDRSNCNLDVIIEKTYLNNFVVNNNEGQPMPVISDLFSGCNSEFYAPINFNPWLETVWTISDPNLIVNEIPNYAGFGIEVEWPTGTGSVDFTIDIVTNNDVNYVNETLDGDVLYTYSFTVNYSDLSTVSINSSSSNSFPSPFCAAANTFDLVGYFNFDLINPNDIPEGTIISWETPFGTLINGANDGTEIAMEYLENAISGGVRCILTFPCGEIMELPPYFIDVAPGLPLTPDIVGPTLVCFDSPNATYIISDVPNADDYVWTVNHVTQSGSDPTFNFTFPTADTYIISVVPIGVCGEGDMSTTIVEVVEDLGYNTISSITPADNAQLIYAAGNPDEDFILSMNPCDLVSSCTQSELDKAFLDLELDLGDLYEYGYTDFSSYLKISLNMYDSYVGGNLTESIDITLDISTEQPCQVWHHDITDIFLSTYRYEITILAYDASIPVQQEVEFEAGYSVEWLQDVRTENHLFDMANFSASAINNSSKIRFDWPLSCSDLVIDNYQLQVLRLFDLRDDGTQSDNYVVDWSTALTIETQSNATTIDLSIAEGLGQYIWRVRPIGNFFANGIGDNRNWGLFSSTGAYFDGAEVGNSSESFAFTLSSSDVNPMDPNINWIYSRVFVEGGIAADEGVKIGESMNYANGLNQSLLNQSLSNENGLIVSQSIYDYSGRVAIQTIPAPVLDQNSFGFDIDHLMKIDQNTAYSANNFDICGNWNNPNSTFDGLGSVQSYYSDLNLDAPVADAEGYAFTRTLFGTDGRIKEQSAPGQTLRINDIVQKHTTRTFYSGVMQDELLRIFGEEAPVASNVQKVITIDPNGVASGSYLAKTGKVLATFLIDNNHNNSLDLPDNPDPSDEENALNALPQSEGDLLVGLSSKPDSFIAREVVDNHIPIGQNAVQSNTTITITNEPTQLVTLDYWINPSTFVNECEQFDFCTLCDYKVIIKVLPLEVDLCATEPLEPILNETLYFPGGFFENCPTPQTEIWTDAIDLAPGSYLISMTIFTGNIDPITVGETENDLVNIGGTSYLTQSTNALEEIISQGYSDALFGSSLGVFVDLNNENLLSEGLGSEINPNFSLDGMYAWWISNTPNGMTIEYEDNNIISFSYVPIGFCEPINIPYSPCLISNDNCEIPNTDFEGDFNSYWASQDMSLYPSWTGGVPPTFEELMSGSIYDDFLTPSQYGAAFDMMIDNMVNESNNLYSCSDILSCWDHFKSSYITQISGYNELSSELGVIVEYDFIDEFLNCVGTHYYGFTDNFSLETGSVYYNTQTTPSFITHAYSYFYFDIADVPSNVFDADTDNTPLDFCFHNCMQLTPDIYNSVCIIDDTENQTFIDNYDDPNISNFIDWSWNDMNLITPAQSNTFWHIFQQCEANLNPVPDELTQEQVDEIVQDVNVTMIDECLTRCNMLYDDFRESIIDEYHALGQYVVDDIYLMEPTFSSQADHDQYLVFLETIVSGEVEGQLLWPNHIQAIYDAQNISFYPSGWVINTDYLISFYGGINFIPDNMLISECELDCLSNALLNHCKESCDLSWITESTMDAPVPTYPVGHPNEGQITVEALTELAEVQEVLTSSSFDLSFPENGECAEGYDYICIDEPALVDENRPEIDYELVKKGIYILSSNSPYTGTEPLEYKYWKTFLTTDPLNGAVDDDGCSTCSNTPSIQEFIFAFNDAVNDFLPYLQNSITAGEFVNYNGWQANATGDEFKWIWEHPYFLKSACPKAEVSITIKLNVLCGNYPFDYQGGDFFTYVASDPNALDDFYIYELALNMTDDGSNDDLVFDVFPGCSGVSSASIQDMFDVSMEDGFTQTQFSLLTVNEEIDIYFPNPTGPGIYYGSFYDGNDSYVRNWTLLSGNDNCGIDGGSQNYPISKYDYYECASFYRLLPFCGRECPGVEAALCFDWGQQEVIDSYLPHIVLCEEENTNQVFNSVTVQMQNVISDAIVEHVAEYNSVCTDPLMIDDEFSYEMELAYHHYTLYTYDRAGNLISTVPPEGVELQNEPFVRDIRSHRMVTSYHYNSLNQLMSQETPDGGEAKFYYNEIGQLRFSQNAQQVIDGQYSYTKYDDLSRIFEAGVCEGSIFTAILEENINNPEYPWETPTTLLSEKMNTHYSTASLSPMVEQNFLQNRVSYVISEGITQDEEKKTIYSYDIHGNVDKLYQVIPGLGLKTVEYSYDLVSGNVLEVAYQQGEIDQFFHRYDYDSDNRLIEVETSVDAVLWENDADYAYYIHGPLRRTEIGQDKVQGLDYVYTLNGWLKSMNHPSLDPNTDVAGDGNTSSHIAKDAFGMQLNYFSGDFRRTTNGSNGELYTIYDSGDVLTSDLGSGNLYNGNINSWISQTQYGENSNGIKYEDKMTAYTYRYDELNRLKQANFHSYDASTWSAQSDYYSFYQYDANGNLEYLKRNAHGTGTMDEIGYDYDDDDGSIGKVNNKLYHFSDSGNDVFETDLEDLTSDYDNSDPNGANNFSYDAIGNLIQDDAEYISEINWTITGKIKSIIHDGWDISDPDAGEGVDIYFEYDALGNRISKRVVHKDSNGDPVNEDSWVWTYYVRDASGNVMSTYTKTNVADGADYISDTRLTEVPLYGSSRVGLFKPNTLIESLQFNEATGEFIELDTQEAPITVGTVASSFDEVTNQTTIYRMGLANDNMQIMETYGVYSGSPSPAVNITTDRDGNTLFSFQGIVDQGSAKSYLFDANGNLIPGSLGIVLGKESEVAVMLVDIDKYLIFTLDDNGKLYHHTIDMKMNNGLGGVPQKNGFPLINNPIEINNKFQATMAVSILGQNDLALLLRKIDDKSNDKNVLFALPFDLQKNIFGKGIEIGGYFAVADNFGDGVMSLSTKHNSVSIAKKNPSTYAGDALVYVKPNSSNKTLFKNSSSSSSSSSASVYQLKYSFAGLVGGEIEDMAFSPTGNVIYYIESKDTQVYLNRYNLLTKANNNLLMRTDNGIPSSIKTWSDGQVYLTNFGSTGMTVLENPDEKTPSQLVFSEVSLPTNVSFSGRLPQSMMRFPLPLVQMDTYTRNMNLKMYELNDHLGNVRNVISDVKIPGNSGNGGAFVPADFTADIVSANNYYPGGMIQPGRSFNANSYRYGFNGQEKDDEIAGSGNSYTAEYWQYDPRLGRRWNLDPVPVAWESGYAAFRNNPILYVDPDGDFPFKSYKKGDEIKVRRWFRTVAVIKVVDFTDVQGGVSIKLKYTDKKSGKTDLRWIQTVRTNTPINVQDKQKVKPINDPTPSDDPVGADKPFYYTDAEVRAKGEPAGESEFSDKPRRNGRKHKVVWKGELSIVGKDDKGNYKKDQTLTYGYKVKKDGTVKLIKLRKKGGQSNFQNKSIKKAK